MSNHAPQSEPGWKVLRPKQWFYFCSLVVAGLDDGVLLSTSPASIARKVIAAGGCAACLLGFAYGLNAIADRFWDVDPEKNPLSGQISVRLPLIVWVAAAGLAALGLSFLLGGIAPLAAAVSIVAAWCYSSTPRAKRWPLIGLFFNILIFAPLLGLLLDGWSDRPSAFDLLLTSFIGLLAQSQLLHELADATEDHGAGDCTTAGLLGPLWTPLLGVCIGMVTVLVAVWIAPRPELGALACGTVATATIALYWLRRHPARARRVHRWICLAGGACLWVGSRAWH